MSASANAQRSTAGALIEKHALGSAGFCMLIVLALTGISGPLDTPLRFSLWFACVGIPLFLSLYVAKEEIEALRKCADAKRDKALSLVSYVSYCALLFLGLSITMLAAHRSPLLGLVFFLSAMSPFWLSAALRKITT
ncbi:conserved hypothetical protein (plasmid) [Paraburkholderia phytofirmans PsJN]|uniref:Transmembrane protein n=2 Tax=Paraburkholderia phytofirmans TaxID=261302 RepID=B2TH17_PARPJ|nr:conserved hypothetical protein [Paraburkholderia phytofirmans PsJN]